MVKQPESGNGEQDGRQSLADGLSELGFRLASTARSGEQTWAVAFNRHLTFTVHESGGETLVLSWAFGLGDYVEERGWRMSVTDTSTAELYPQHDVRIAADVGAVRAEISRVLQQLRLDLGDPDL